MKRFGIIGLSFHDENDVDPTTLLNHLADCLWKVAASTVEIQRNRVVFTRRMFRLVSNWNVLVPFERGDLTIDADTREVRYCLSIPQVPRQLRFLKRIYSSL